MQRPPVRRKFGAPQARKRVERWPSRLQQPAGAAWAELLSASASVASQPSIAPRIADVSGEVRLRRSRSLRRLAGAVVRLFRHATR